MKSEFLYLTSETQLNILFEKIVNAEFIAMDTETTSLDSLTGALLLIQINIDDEIFIIDVKSVGIFVIKKLILFLKEEAMVPLVFHNAKFDLKFLYTYSGILLERVYDTQLAEVILTMGVGAIFPALNDIVLKYCSVFLDKKVREEFAVATSITQEMLIYSALDVKYLNNIRTKQMKKLKEDNLIETLLLEMKLIPVVAMMELEGLLLDSKVWLDIHSRMIIKKDRLKKNLVKSLIKIYLKKETPANALEAYRSIEIPAKTQKLILFLENITEIFFIETQLNENLNINSYKQLKNILNLCNVPVLDTTAGELKMYSDNKLIAILLEYKSFSKLENTYGLNYLEHIHLKTGKLHAQANQLGTRTGRFSYNSPNLQQVPTYREKDKAIYRNCFIARKGYSFVTIDYSQAELRLAGAISGEQRIIDSYIRGDDIHAVTASLIFHKDLKDVTKEERLIGKTINFSILYGSTAYGVTKKNPEIPLSLSESLLESFFSGYPQLKLFIDILSDFIWDKKMSITALGRRRYFELETDFEHPWQANSYKRRVIRQGINLVVQGSSADCLKIAMVDLFYKNPFSQDELALRIQVHDELVVEVKNTILEEGVIFIRKCMIEAQQPFLGLIPAEADHVVSTFWTK